ncbi:MAG: MarR family winged helix-turn-helix transcriptional regulator [Peptococcaceae bacterium]
MGEDKSVGKWISVLHRLGQMNLDKELNAYNLSRGQFIFLLTLFKEDGISQEQLAGYLCMDKGTTARAMKKLEAAGYIRRRTCPADKRMNKIFLNDKAYAIKPELENICMNWTGQLLKGFDPDEKEAVLKMLEQMSANAAEFLRKID